MGTYMANMDHTHIRINLLEDPLDNEGDSFRFVGVHGETSIVDANPFAHLTLRQRLLCWTANGTQGVLRPVTDEETFFQFGFFRPAATGFP